MSHLKCLESPKEKRANNRSKAEKLGESRSGKQKMLISCGNPQASLPEPCATVQELVAAAVKSLCSGKAQANVLASLWRLFQRLIRLAQHKAGLQQSRNYRSICWAAQTNEWWTIPDLYKGSLAGISVI